MNYLPYIITEVFLIFYTVSLLLRLNNNFGSINEVQELKNIIYMYILNLAADMFWALTEGGFISPPKILNAAVNSILLCSTVLGCYVWFRYVTYRARLNFVSAKNSKILLIVPVIIAVVLNIASIFTGWTFSIGTNGRFETGKLFLLQSVISYLYLLFATVLSVSHAVKSNYKPHKYEFFIYATYIVPGMLCGFLEDFIPTVPILSLSMYLEINVIFMLLRDRQITRDVMTGLNNKRVLDEQLEKEISKSSKKHPVSVFMIDIDNFKKINDVYGHIAGDDAIKLVAHCLKATAQKYGLTVCRYGGDEFSLINASHTGNNEIVKALKEEIRNACTVSHLEFEVTVSIGYAICTDKHYHLQKLIDSADAFMYREKQSKKAKNISA